MGKSKVDEPPQIITSPDGKAQIINYRIIIGRFGDMSAEGAVRNISSEYNLSAVVKADYYDANGEYVDSEIDTVRRLNPSDTRAFEVVFSGQHRYKVKSVKLSLNTKN